MASNVTIFDLEILFRTMKYIKFMYYGDVVVVLCDDNDEDDNNVDIR